MMNFLKIFKMHPLTTAIFIVTFISLSLIFIIGIYKFALVVLLSLLITVVGYIIERSGVLK